ncbi:malate dehydrogenase, mitochondrial-like [Harmonia axyridis]|uniref:malate dehydrogenase, mitochondrial-like n=1 Tax=Harmonia axyridis TaxID=115357 RepID=UPI001E279237|nr:malate dehydrogenase, mitochondrial-like [Harmonia axyridis]
MIQNFSSILKRILNPKLTRNFGCVSNEHIKVTIIGGMGSTGKPLAMLLKQSPLIDELCIYDVRACKGFVHELNHIDTRCTVTGHCGKCNLGKALQNSRIIVMLMSVTKGSIQNYSAQFEQNAPLVQCITEFIGNCSPKSLIAVGTNPVNSMVPLVSEVMKRKGAYSPNNIFGVTTVNSVRANTLSAAALGLDAECVIVPVVGGHTETTMVPVLSKAKPCSEFTPEIVEKITRTVRYGMINVAKLKTNSADSLAGAFAFARFVISLVKGLRGYQGIVECSYVRSKVHPQLKYLANPLLLGPAGVMRNLGIPKLNDYEKCLFDNIIPILINDIQRGEKYVGVYDPPICNLCDENPLPERCPNSVCTRNPPC